MKFSLETALAHSARKVEERLAEAIDNHVDPLVADPIRHAVLGGGKRLRAFLVLQSCLIKNVDEENALTAAAAIEAMHAYSLVHDDLPAMDDDDLRRGQPTVHIKWDEATAILAGDALQTLAFALLTELTCKAERQVVLIAGLARASGARGMVLGQAQDIAAETTTQALSLAEIMELQGNKTGALFEWSATTGAVLAGTDETALRQYAQLIGLAFQIKDDILDIEGDSAIAGKRLQKDDEAGKATFVSLLGLEAAKENATNYVEQAKQILEPYGEKAIGLRELAQFIITRKM